MKYIYLKLFLPRLFIDLPFKYASFVMVFFASSYDDAVNSIYLFKHKDFLFGYYYYYFFSSNIRRTLRCTTEIRTHSIRLTIHRNLCSLPESDLGQHHWIKYTFSPLTCPSLCIVSIFEILFPRKIHAQPNLC
jgi:hypothetical protein